MGIIFVLCVLCVLRSCTARLEYLANLVSLVFLDVLGLILPLYFPFPIPEAPQLFYTFPAPFSARFPLQRNAFCGILIPMSNHTIIEPHVHMLARTTDDYHAMYDAGIRVCVEPSFWLGENRRWAESFWDYFNLILNFETVRARRSGIDHWCAIGMNPKESEDVALASRVIDGMEEYLEHPRCVAIGEIGFNNITPNEEKALVRQLLIAEEKKFPVILHLPHFQKMKGITRVLEIVRAEGLTPERIDIDHNVEETIGLALEAGCYAGMTVYPFSKLSPERISAIIKEHGSKKVIVNGSADWGVSDPLALIKVRDRLRLDGHSEETIQALTFDNANAFYAQNPKWKPIFNFNPIDPAVYQRQP